MWCHLISQRIWNPQPKSFLAKLCAATAGNWKPPFGRIVRLLGGLGNSFGGLIKRQVGAPTGIYRYVKLPRICLGNEAYPGIVKWSVHWGRQDAHLHQHPVQRSNLVLCLLPRTRHRAETCTWDESLLVSAECISYRRELLIASRDHRKIHTCLLGNSLLPVGATVKYTPVS